MKFSAVLLAGGESRRMGSDKAMILFLGRTLWQHQLDLLRGLKPDEIFVSARAEPSWQPPAVEFVPDQQPSRGPLSGICAALSRATADHLLVVGIDMPFMTNDYLSSLLRRCRPGCGIVPVIENRAEPLAAIYPRSSIADFKEALSGTDFSLQPLVSKLIASGKLQSIPVSDEERRLFGNLNEPQDLAV